MPNSVLDRVSPYILLVLAASFWGGNFNIARAFNAQLPPLGLSFWRWTLALLVILPFIWKPMVAQWSSFKQHRGLVLLLALLGVTGFNSLVYLGLQTTTATNGVLMQSINPIFIIILSGLLLGEQASLRQWLGVMISLGGVIVILVRGDLETLKTLAFQRGDLIILIAVADWALYTVLLRKLPPTLKGLPILGYTVCIGWLALVPLYAYEHLMVQRYMPFNMTSIISVTYVAVFASVLAYLFWNHGAAKIGASRTGQFAHIVPVAGILIATLVLGEQLHSYHLLGIVLVASGIILANLPLKTSSAVQQS
ncbi:DMT family transporter [Thiolinea disciformis]|uniref:DMT family transporter n=1 Tax=Thiolinea disciformis TaxID=125614 RepID=UPI00035D3C5B|nr:DMT family transporter [Thiolinea disciformis]